MDKMLRLARIAMRNSYSPYSKLRVGAALLTEDGKIFTGCNVENSSYGDSICAERVAICKAVSEGYKSFRALAVTSSQKEPTYPCGSCRQVLAEFNPEMVILVDHDKNSRYKLSDLLPKSFTLKQKRKISSGRAPRI